MRIIDSRQLIVFGILFGALLWSPAAEPVAAQETPREEATDSLRQELEALRAQLDSLRAVVERLQAQGREEEAAEAAGALERLREAARAAAGQADTTAAEPEEQEFVGRQRSLQALNPEISVNADIFGHVDTDDPDADNFVAREFEFSFQAALDPFSRAKIFVSHHVPGAELEPFEGEEGHAHEEGGGGLAVEEGYVEWVNLPAGFSLKLGKLFQQFGQLNRWHAHALPFQSRSLPHLAYIGEEALAQTGASVRWLVPVHGAGTYEATFEATRSSNETLFGESHGPSYLGHVNAFWQLSRSVDFEIGVSGLFGEHEDPELGEQFDQRLYGVETAFNWIPPGQSRYRGFTFRGGAMMHDGEEEALGLWSMAEVRLSQQWLVGARYDRVENPADPEQTAWLFSPTLTWWQSEWVRVRAEYDLLGRDIPGVETDDVGKFLLQVTFAMGPHKHETY